MPNTFAQTIGGTFFVLIVHLHIQRNKNKHEKYTFTVAVAVAGTMSEDAAVQYLCSALSDDLEERAGAFCFSI